MRDRLPRYWLARRFAPVSRPDHTAPAGRPPVHRMALPPGTPTSTMHTPTPAGYPADPLADVRCETPDADGVRRGMVARAKQLIAEGYYDAPTRWAAAEELLFDHADGAD